MQLLCDQLEPESLPLNVAFREKKKLDSEKLSLLFFEAQSSIVALLAQKKSSIPNSDYQKLVEDITTVTLGSFEEPVMQKIFPNACSRPNAIYIAGLHRVFVCPSLLNYPETTLQQILAHELGHVVQKMQDSIPCFKSYPKAQLNEVFADWVASKVLAGRLTTQKDSLLAKKQAFESQLLFLSIACSPAAKSKADWAHTHPNIQNRIEKIFLSQPAVQKALSCEGTQTKACG